MKATGRLPASAWPMQDPTIVDSDSGELRTREGNSVLSPLRDAEHVAFGIFDVLAQQDDIRVV